MATTPASLPLPPGRLGPPLVGETFTFLKDPFAFFEERYRRHGPVFKTRLLGDTVVGLVGPDAIAFFNDERFFARRGATPRHMQEILHPDAAPFLDGAAQKKRRQLLLKAFTPDALRGYGPTLERITVRFLERFAGAGEVRGVDELGSLCFTIANALFAGADPDGDRPDLAAVFDRVVAGVFAMPVKLPFTTYGKSLRARDVLRGYIGTAVDAYAAGTADHLLERLVAARDEHGSGLTPEEVKIEILHFFAAAYAGLQAGLCNAVLALAQHPEVAERARAEVRAAAPRGALGDAVERLSYVSQVTREVRRFYRMVPTTFFAQVKDDCEFGGYRLPKGWKATAILHSTMHDERTFTEPQRFDPERFSPERAEDRRRPNSYVPHGGGPMDGHRCAGEALADRVLATFVALAVRDHRWSVPAQDLSWKLGGLCPLPRDGLRVRFVREAH